MTSNSGRGFTIIEVMLFLAITGGLFALLMIGVNTSVTQQRYLDSVRGYKALLQNEYAEVLTTRNEGSESQKCRGTDGTVGEGASGVEALAARGTSKCVILGRAIQVDGGNRIFLSSVTGFDPTGTAVDTNSNGIADAKEIDSSDDLTALGLYQPKLSTFDKRTMEVDWGARLVRPGGQDSTAVILVLRSPATGVIKVFSSENSLGNSVNLAGMITSDNTTSAATVGACIDGDSGLLPKQFVSVDPRIASPDAVKTDGGESGRC